MRKDTRKRGKRGRARKTARNTMKGGRKNTNDGLQCHPSRLKETPANSNTCLTYPILKQIKERYNEKHPQEPLLANEPIALYHEISQKFGQSCKEEKCWIRQMMGSNAEKLEKQLYRPYSPADWKKNPVEWLSNFDIDAVMNQYEETYPEFEFLGSVPSDFDLRVNGGNESTCISRDVCSLHLDEKIRQGKTKIGIVFNLSTHDSGGSHWVSMYIHLPDSLIQNRTNGGEQENEQILGGSLENGVDMELELEKEKGGKGQPWGANTPYCFFFDSVGDSAPKEVMALVKRLQKEWKHSKMNVYGNRMFYDSNHRTDAEHQQGNTECGIYSLFFLITMLTGKCAGGVLEQGQWKGSEVCSAPLKTEQEKINYFQGLAKSKNGGKLLIPDEFMVKLRKYYFNPSP